MKNARHEEIVAHYKSEFLDDMVSETFWGLVINAPKGLYQVTNIPFYGPEFANGDIIHALKDEETGMLTYQEIVEHSGHSTIQVVQTKDSYNMDGLLGKLHGLGAYVESLDKTFFVIDLPPNKSYGPIYKELLLAEKAGNIGFAEPVLTEQHLRESNRKSV